MVLNPDRTSVVLATRPLAQNRLWSERLSALGFRVIQTPLLAILPTSDTVARQADSKVMGLDLYQRVIFISQNAVSHGFEKIERFWPQLPVRVEFYATGSKTAKMVEERLDSLFNVRMECRFAMTSETFLALPELQQVSDEKILIFRGEGGRTKLKQELESRGAQVDFCELYTRKAETMTSEVEAALQEPSVIVPLFSGETLTSFADQIQMLNCVEKIKAQWKVVLPGQRVYEQAKGLGFQQLYMAENASEPAMLNSIQLADGERSGR